MDRESGSGREPHGGPFEALDGKLNIFALANGIDLKREAASRRLEWHRDGLERGILVEVSDAGAFTVSALAWNHGDPSPARRDVRCAGLEADEIVAGLSAILQTTLDAANAL